VFDEEQLRKLGRAERLRLIRALVALESPAPAADQVVRRRRAVALAAIIVCCVILAAWTGVLAVTLPRYYRSGGWRGAWVGFDLAELAAFAATGWAALRRSQGTERQAVALAEHIRWRSCSASARPTWRARLCRAGPVVQDADQLMQLIRWAAWLL
jgi:hypothetical protein